MSYFLILISNHFNLYFRTEKLNPILLTINGVVRRGLAANLKSLPNGSANPPGPHCGNDTDMNNVVQSYWSRDDDGIGKSDRFKLLKYKKFHVTQNLFLSYKLVSPTGGLKRKVERLASAFL